MTDPPSPRDALTGRLREVLESLLEREDTSFTELTVTSICQAAGISRPTFYAYFDDKVGLVRAIAADTIADLVGVAASWLDAPKSTRAELNRAMAELFAAYAPHRRLMVAAAEVATYDSELHDAFTSAMEIAARRVSEHIEAGQAAGVVRRDVAPVATARWLAWMTELGLRNGFEGSSAANPASVAAMTDIHWFTLYERV